MANTIILKKDIIVNNYLKTNQFQNKITFCLQNDSNIKLTKIRKNIRINNKKKIIKLKLFVKLILNL